MNRPAHIENLVRDRGIERPRFAYSVQDPTFPLHVWVEGVGWVVNSVAGFN